MTRQLFARVFVDPLAGHGWVLRGRSVQSCHLFAGPDDLDELHRVAAAAGCKREWFQRSGGRGVPHYDLTASRRSAAIKAGAEELPRREAVAFWREHYPRSKGSAPEP
jgi:hypothetical protein